MDLSDTQILELFDAHWAGRVCTCPSCGGPLTSKHSGILGGYVLCFRCPKACDIPDLESNRDPRQTTFRDWTSEEGAKLIVDYMAKRSPRCPVCAIPVCGQEKWTFSGRLVLIRCERCGKVCEESLPR